MLCVAALCLLLDLGRPEFAYLLFTQPTTSVLSFGSYTLLASLIVGGFLVVANLFYVPFVHARARKIAEVACIVASVCLMTYTGVYVACMEAVALWNNIAIPVLFALSSASSGLSVMFIAAPFVCDWWAARPMDSRPASRPSGGARARVGCAGGVRACRVS